MSSCNTEVVSDASRIQRVSAYQRPDERRVAVCTDQAVCFRSAVMKAETLPEFLIRVKTQVQRIQKASMDEPEADTADLSYSVPPQL